MESPDPFILTMLAEGISELMFIHKAGGKYSLLFQRQTNLSPSFHLFCFPGGELLDLPEALSPLFLGGLFITPPHLSSGYLREGKHQWKEPNLFLPLG